jgi:hypothetical protein
MSSIVLDAPYAVDSDMHIIFLYRSFCSQDSHYQDASTVHYSRHSEISSVFKGLFRDNVPSAILVDRDVRFACKVLQEQKAVTFDAQNIM